MIEIIIKKEWTEYHRDGRVLMLSLTIGFLVVLGLVTGATSLWGQQQARLAAQESDGRTFNDQGEKTPHGAAHFGRMAYKPIAPLAIFDPGSGPYLGQVIWLEAHHRDPAMFRPAEDSPELRRLADLSVAGVLRVLLPLLVCLLGYGTFANEKMRGTLRQVLCTGPNIGKLFLGKGLAIFSLVTAAVFFTILASLTIATFAPSQVSFWDVLHRSLWLCMGYALYVVAFTAVALWVSSQVQRGTSALFILLSLWVISVVILPRVAADVAEKVYPIPDSGTFWTETRKSIREARLDVDSQAYRDIQRQILSKALGREVADEALETMTLNRRGLRLEALEIMGAKAFDQAYDQLYRIHEKQRRLRRIFALLSPTIALQHFSSAICGTHIDAHRHFAHEAERQRQVMVSKMNEDMMLHGAGKGFSYVAQAEFWETIPAFTYQLPTANWATKSAQADFWTLALWSLTALGLAWQATHKLRIL